MELHHFQCGEKLTISMAMFNSYVTNYQGVSFSHLQNTPVFLHEHDMIPLAGQLLLQAPDSVGAWKAASSLEVILGWIGKLPAMCFCLSKKIFDIFGKW